MPDKNPGYTGFLLLKKRRARTPKRVCVRRKAVTLSPSKIRDRGPALDNRYGVRRLKIETGRSELLYAGVFPFSEKGWNSVILPEMKSPG